jgi:hypothetical protein
MALPLSATSNETAYHDGARPYPALSLADARAIRADYLSMLATGVESANRPEQTQEQHQIALDSIFLTVARPNWYALKLTSVTEDYAKDIWRSLDKDIFPSIGSIRSGNQSSNTD